jgi:hypothetical protein
LGPICVRRKTFAQSAKEVRPKSPNFTPRLVGLKRSKAEKAFAFSTDQPRGVLSPTVNRAQKPKKNRTSRTGSHF